MICKIHKVDMECLGGRNAHRSNWYCPMCDIDKDHKDLVYRIALLMYPNTPISIGTDIAEEAIILIKKQYNLESGI